MTKQKKDIWNLDLGECSNEFITVLELIKSIISDESGNNFNKTEYV